MRAQRHPATTKRISTRHPGPHSRIALRLLVAVLIAVSVLSGCRAEMDPKEATAAAVTQAAAEGTILPPEELDDVIPGQPVTGNYPEPGSEEPLRFTFPTPGPAPISLWRPPLYDTPWALGPNDHFFFYRPIAADDINWPLPDYRYGGIFFSSDIVHTGIDIPAPLKTTIIAAGDGRVVWAGYGLYRGGNDPDDPYGLAVTIRHDFGFNGRQLYTVYAHMDRIDVITGQDVKTGDPLGIIGMTGLTTGPHLHFEVRMERNSYFTTYNPELWLAPPQGWGVLAGKLQNTNGSLLYHHDVYVRNKETRQRWVVRSYGNSAVNSDPYYNENLALSDLPAGEYEIMIEYMDEDYRQDITIQAGAISYFSFRGKLSFDTALPPTPSIDEMLTGIDAP